MSLKIPILNRDILEEIVPQFNSYNNEDNEKEAAEALEKFMLSGKEPYEAVLRHFSHVFSVIIGSVTFGIITKRHILKRNRKFNLYKLPYDFSFLDDILAVLAESNTMLGLKAYPSSLPGRKVLARLTQKHLKHIGFDDGGKLPADYYKFFQNECHFKHAHLDLCFAKKALLFEFLKLPSQLHSIRTHFGLFFQKIRLTGSPFSTVKSLSFVPCQCEEPFEDYPFDFMTAKAIRDFASLIIKVFPNLKTLSAVFSAVPKDSTFARIASQSTYPWKSVYAEMKKMNPEMFKIIPPHIKGKMKFYYACIREPLNIVAPWISPDSGVKIDEVKKQLIRKFNIHDELTFEFVYQLWDKEEEIGAHMVDDVL